MSPDLREQALQAIGFAHDSVRTVHQSFFHQGLMCFEFGENDDGQLWESVIKLETDCSRPREDEWPRLPEA